MKFTVLSKKMVGIIPFLLKYYACLMPPSFAGPKGKARAIKRVKK